MNITPYIIKEYEYKRFDRDLEQDHPVVKELYDKFGDTGSFKDVSVHLALRAANGHYGLDSISCRGNKIISYNVREHYYEGRVVSIRYKGVEFRVEMLSDGSIHKVYQRNEGLYSLSHSSHKALPKLDSLEEYYLAFINNVKQSKRECMNHYNKLIKDIKQEYREKLAQHNKFLRRTR